MFGRSTFSFLVLLALAAMPMTSWAQGKFATVDMARVLREYDEVKRVAAQLQARKDEYQEDIDKKQQEISTGLRIQRPSDDPSGMRRSLIQKDRLERLDSHISSIQFAQSRLSQAAVQLQDANSLLVRARGIALQAPQTT